MAADSSSGSDLDLQPDAVTLPIAASSSGRGGLPIVGGLDEGSSGITKDSDSEEADEFSSSVGEMEPDTGGHFGRSVPANHAAQVAKRLKRFSPQPGASSGADLHHWPAAYRTTLMQEGYWQNVADKLQHGVVLDSDYSGSGCMEQAAAMVRSHTLAADPGLAAAGAPCFTVHRTCDNNPRCQRLLCEHEQGPEHAAHVFTDICDRVERAVLDGLYEICDRWNDHLKDLSPIWQGAAAEQKALLQMVGKAQCKELVSYLKAVQDPIKPETFCTAHDRMCPLFRVGRMNIWSGGNRCLDWSAFGKQANWSGRDTVPFIIWCFSIRSRRPDVVIQECTPRFDLSVFREVLGQRYTIQCRRICPTQLGAPIRRKRQWAIAVLAEKWQVLHPFDGPLYSSLFYRQTICSADIYFKDSQVHRKAEIQRMARLRGMPPLQPDGSPWPLLSVLAPGQRARVFGYQKLAATSKSQRGRAIVANIGQNPDERAVFGDVMPTLLTQSVLALLRSDDLGLHFGDDPLLMTGSEHLAAMGWPIFDPAIPNALSPVLTRLDDSFKKHLAGNGMHIMVAGSVLLYVLANVVPTKAVESKSEE